jgi:PhnB protein
MSTDTNKTAAALYLLAPMLSVRNGKRALEFYKSAFGALEVYRVEDPSGAVVAQLSIERTK